MARKIKFTSKVIKKWCLIALLVALVVGFGIIVVQSFDKDNILSNNTVLNDLDYSDEYRLYLEKQLIIKSHTDDYEDVIANKKADAEAKMIADSEKEIKDLYEAAEKKKAEIDAKYQKTIDTANSDYNKKVAEFQAKFDSGKISEDELKNEIERAKSNLETKLAEIQGKCTTEKLPIDNDLNEKIKTAQTNLELNIKTIDEEYLIGLIIEELLRIPNPTDEGPKYYSLSEVIKRVENTPTGYVYSTNSEKNSAIKAEFDFDKTELANTTGSFKDDVLSGKEFTVEGDSTKYIYSGKSGNVVYTVNVQTPGYYNILLDYIPYTTTKDMKASNDEITEESGGAAIERNVYVDGVIPFADLANISFMRAWSDGGEKFVDVTGNEIKPKQIETPQRIQQYVRDSVGYVTEPYLVYFTEGVHEIKIESIRENMGIANVYLTSKKTICLMLNMQKNMKDNQKFLEILLTIFKVKVENHK